MVSAELFQLIHSFSVAEVRYFRRYAGRHRSNSSKYLLLFDALREMNVYDELVLRQKLKGEALLKQLPAARNYLGKMLLRALREYQFEGSLVRKLRARLDELETLYSRGLRRAALRTTQKGLQLAQEGGEPLLALQFLQWQRRLSRNNPGVAQPDEAESLVLDQIKGETELIQAYDQVYRMARQRLLGTALATNMPSLPPRPPNSFNGEIAYHTTKALLAQFQHQPEEAHQAFRLNLETWHRFPVQIQDHPTRYISALSNFLASCHMLHKYDDFAHLIGQVHSDSIPKAHWPRVRSIFLNYQLLFAVNMEQWELVESLEGEIQLWLERFTIPPTQDLNLRYNLWVTHFVRGNLGNAWFWLRSILNRPREAERQDIQDLARLLELVHLYEQGEEEVLAYRLRSVKRFLRSRTDLPSWYLVLAQFMQSRTNQTQTTSMTQLLELLRANTDNLGQAELLRWANKTNDLLKSRS